MSKFKKENIISISENFINNLKYYKIKFKDEKDAKSYFPSTISKKDVELCEKLIKNNNIKLLNKKRKSLNDSFDNDFHLFKENKNENSEESDDDSSSSSILAIRYTENLKENLKTKSKELPKNKTKEINNSKNNSKNNSNNVSQEFSNNISKQFSKNISKENPKQNDFKSRKPDLLHDVPLRVVNVGKRNGDRDLYCEVEWENGENNEKMENTIVSTKHIKQFYPHLLIDYYESKIIFAQEID